MRDRSDPPVIAPISEDFPGGGVRTHAVVDEAMIRRLGYGQYASTRWLWWVLGPVLILGPVVIWLAEGSAKNSSALVNVPLAMMLGSLIFGSIRYGVLYRGGPDYWKYENGVTAGTTVYADISPEWVGIGWKDTYTALGRVHVERVTRHKSVLAIAGCATAIYIPEELLPPESATALLSQSQQGNQSDLSPAAPTTPPPPMVAAQNASGTDEAIRTGATADATLADRLARSVRNTSAVRLALLLILLLPVAGVVALVLDDERHLVDSMFLSLVSMGAAGFCIIGYYMFVGVRADLRKLLPEGTALAAVFRPDNICVQLGGRAHVVGTDRIKKVEQVDSALVVTRNNPRKGLFIPDELVPPHIAEELLQRFG